MSHTDLDWKAIDRATEEAESRKGGRMSYKEVFVAEFNAESRRLARERLERMPPAQRDATAFVAAVFLEVYHEMCPKEASR